jgi:putative SOS response-associated peptidase YedK
VRKVRVREGKVEINFFAFLTCEPNAVVAPIHQKAMPVILTKPKDIETWLTAPSDEAKLLQRSLPDDGLIEVEAAQVHSGRLYLDLPPDALCLGQQRSVATF